MTQVIVVARLRAAEGKGDRLAALLTEQCGVVRATEPGCIAYRLLRAKDDPEIFVFYEAYVDDDAFEAHRQSPHLARFRQKRDSEGLTAGPADVQLYRALTD